MGTDERPPRHYRITFHALTTRQWEGQPVAQRLRRLLKLALRACGLRNVSGIEELPCPDSVTPPARAAESGSAGEEN